jgi:hypothetical protein
MTNIHRTKEIDTKQEETGETLIFHRKQRENADKSEGHGERQRENADKSEGHGERQRENADKSEGHGARQKEERKRVIIC